jgi:hypothetical protein
VQRKNSIWVLVHILLSDFSFHSSPALPVSTVIPEVQAVCCCDWCLILQTDCQGSNPSSIVHSLWDLKKLPHLFCFVRWRHWLWGLKTHTHTHTTPHHGLLPGTCKLNRNGVCKYYQKKLIFVIYKWLVCAKHKADWTLSCTGVISVLK